MERLADGGVVTVDPHTDDAEREWDEAPTLEALLAAGDVAFAVVFPEGITESEAHYARQGFEAGRKCEAARLVSRIETLEAERDEADRGRVKVMVRCDVLRERAVAAERERDEAVGALDDMARMCSDNGHNMVVAEDALAVAENRAVQYAAEAALRACGRHTP